MSPYSPGSVTEFDTEIARELENIHQSLTLPAEQGKVLEFLMNAENVQRINGLIEDICEALMEYQVCMSSCSSYTMSDVHVRLHCSKICTKRVANSL